jgi:seryl-tRNA synthetase
MIEQVKISDEMSEVLNGMFEQRDFLKAEGDRLHNGFLEEREKADEIHGKMSELMDQVTEARNELKAQNEERKSWLTDHNAAVTDELKSGADDEDVANELVSELLSSGSLSVGGTTSTDSLGGERTRRTKSKKKARVSSFAAARGNRGRSVKKD